MPPASVPTVEGWNPAPAAVIPTPARRWHGRGVATASAAAQGSE